MFLFSVGLVELKLRYSVLGQYQSYFINKLCTKKDKQYSFVFFQFAGDTVKIVEPFWELTKIPCSRIYMHQWKMVVAANCNHSIALSEVKSQLWDPTYETCKALLQKFSTLEITFNEFDSYFEPTDEPNIIADELRCFSKRLNTSISLDDSCIKKICECVQTGRKLQRSHQAADMVLKIKELMSLTGFFCNLEYIAKVSAFSMVMLSFNISITASITDKTMDTRICARRNVTSCCITRRH